MVARPRMMESPRGDGMMHTPALDLMHDLYVAPVEIGGKLAARATDAEPQWLLKNEPLTLNGVEYVFRGFRMEHTGEQYMASADIDVTVNGTKSRVSPGLSASAAGTQPVPADVPGIGALSLARMDADHGRVAIVPPGEQTMLSVVTIDMSTKPWVNLVWVGALLMLIGTAMAGVRRAREQRGASRRAAVPAGSMPVEAQPKPV
jgi:cytochrome c-type biogenesis protein CcmF